MFLCGKCRRELIITKEFFYQMDIGELACPVHREDTFKITFLFATYHSHQTVYFIKTKTGLIIRGGIHIPPRV